MCFVSFYPLGNKEYVITSNRDEYLVRATDKIVTEKKGQYQITFPQDHKGGSWIMHSDQGRVCCLLNGAFVNHYPPQRSYTISRGNLIKELFLYERTVDFIRYTSLFDIEPFTCIILESVDQLLLEFRWDGRHKHIRHLDIHNHHCYSSCTLYTDEMITERKTLFEKMVTSLDSVVPETLLRIHNTSNAANPDKGLIMNRHDQLKTISISQVHVKDDSCTLAHQSLV